MSFRRVRNRHEIWQRACEGCPALSEFVPREALGSEQQFRIFVTKGQLAPDSTRIDQLTDDQLNTLWTFINHDAQFDMEAIRFDAFNAEFAKRSSAAASDAVWSVWRQDDAGNQFLVSSGHPRHEAERIVEAFTRKGHKQIYWAART